MKEQTARLRATSIAPKARRWLAETQQAYVLYSFERAINLLNQEGDVLAIASHSLGNGSFTLLLEPNAFPTGIQDTTEVLVFENGLWLGDWLIDAESASSWNPVPSWSPEKLKAAPETFAILSDLLEQQAPDESMAHLLLDPLTMSPLPARIAQALEQNIPLLRDGLRTNNADHIRGAAKAFAGLGPGLTPAGDDFLIGVMHGLYATRPAEVAHATSKFIAGAAAPRTHLLSAAWLHAAADGEAAEPWHMLITQIGANHLDTVGASAEAILQIGHTSGADALAGFLLVLEDSV